MRAHDGRVVGAIAVVREASVGKRSDLDPSSGLPNEVHFLSRLERSVERAAQTRAYTFAVIGVEMHGLRARSSDGWVRWRRTPRSMRSRVGSSSDCARRISWPERGIAGWPSPPWGSLEEVVERIRAVADEPYTIAGERVTMSTIGAPGPIWSAEGPRLEAHDVRCERAHRGRQTRSDRAPLSDWDASLAPKQVVPVHINLSLSELWNPAPTDELESRAAEAAALMRQSVRMEAPTPPIDALFSSREAK